MDKEAEKYMHEWRITIDRIRRDFTATGSLSHVKQPKSVNAGMMRQTAKLTNLRQSWDSGQLYVYDC